MRTWRVGSISMGASLLLLGVLLFFTQIFHLNSAKIILAWWPIILIILGAEILVYLFRSQKENPHVKYDFLSIFFVGVIGFMGIGLTILTTTGIFDRITDWTSMEMKTMDLPEFDMPIRKNIERVVVHMGNHALTFEDSPSDHVTIFGTYHGTTLKDQVAIHSPQDYLLFKEQGDTLYITLKDTFTFFQPFQDRLDLYPTILVPEHIKLEMHGEHNMVTLKPRNVENNWVVNQVSRVDVLLNEEANISIKANNVEELSGDGWSKVKTEEGTHHSELMKAGMGEYTVSINNAYSVSVLRP